MPKTTGEIVVEQIARAEIARKAGSGEQPKPVRHECRVITISRELGSSGTEAGRILAGRLGWSLWDRELVEEIARNAHVRTAVVERFDEKTVSELESLAHSLAGDFEVGDFLFRRHLTHALLSISRIGHAVILGRGANLILRGSLNVRIMATKEFRVRTLVSRGMGREEAEEAIRHSDRERQAFVRNIFDRDIDNPDDYDLVVKTDALGPQGVAEVILAAFCVFCPDTV